GRGGDGEQLVVLVGDLLDQEAVQPYQGVGVILGDVGDLAAARVVPAQPAEVHVRVGDGLGEFVGGDGGQLIDGRGAQAAVVDRAAGVGDDRVADGVAVVAEGAVVAEDALLGRARPGPEVDGHVGLHVDDVKPVRVGGLQQTAGDVGLDVGLDGRVGDG